jgi:hypothetical protein
VWRAWSERGFLRASVFKDRKVIAISVRSNLTN